MIVSLNAYSLEELDLVADQLGQVASFLRSTGQYDVAARLISRRNLVNQHILRREADHRQYVARQLSLVRPSAYDEPGTT
jgi:hypothetical protein